MPKKKPQRGNVCAYCGRKFTELSYQCTHCGSYFCPDHRLPENHECLWKKGKRKVRLRNGKIVNFDRRRITKTILKTVRKWAVAEGLSDKVEGILDERYSEKILDLRDIRNVVGEVLTEYRKQKRRWRRPLRIGDTIAETVGLTFASFILLGVFSAGILILGNKFGLFSLPWVETIGIVFDWAIYIGILLAILGGFGIVELMKNRKGRIVFPIAGILACLIVGAVFPSVAGVLFWRGEDGESMEELVKHGFSITVGADGHRIWIHNNPDAKNPTYEELLVFLAQDETNLIPYDFDNFVCADYAEMLHNNAEKAGIRSAYVCVDFSSTSQFFPTPFGNSHALDAFKTTDEGLVFIDVSGGFDCVVDVVIDKLYVPIPLFSDVEFYSVGDVKFYKVQW